ncbi:MAG: ribonucleoside-diphosphate reductase subunit alpha [Chlamydiae bacterium]|nr:ribonucleoside-diphosphate reductase subunit alpha [Chlamydiota bacterium]
MKKVKTLEPTEILTGVTKSVLISENCSLNTDLLTVVKRNGRIVPFNRERIEKAIESAFRDTKKVARPLALPEAMSQTIERLTDSVIIQAKTLGEKGVTLTVEGIQDLVEVTLMKNGLHDVARDYIIYRDQHKAKRDQSPENIKIYRHDRSTLVRFNPMKIGFSIARAFRLARTIESEILPEDILAAVNALTQSVVDRAIEKHNLEGSLHLSCIETIIEEELMGGRFFMEAKAFILQKVGKQDTRFNPSQIQKDQSFKVVTEDGKERVISEREIRSKIEHAARNYKEEIDVPYLVQLTVNNFYNGIKEKEVDTAMIMAARSMVERDPAYAFITAGILLDVLYRETMEVSALDPKLEKAHQEYFPKYIKMGISYKRVSPKLLDFDLPRLAKAMDLQRDNLFQYLGLQTLYDRYFIHEEGRRLETPQIFWMRVAMGLALEETDKNERAIEFYNLLSEHYFTSATPTLFNSGTTHSQLSSCYLSTVMDDLHGIFKIIADDAQLSKWAGGIGNDWTNVRATGSLIKGTNGKSQGVIPFLKVANDTAVAVNQGGKRKGAMCAYLETWHLDIEDFLELRKNTGDERRRTHDMNTANWIPDLFMKRVQKNGSWTLFSPIDTPDLHDLYGKAFEERYAEYEKMAAEGRIKNYKTVDALGLWRKMLSMLFETGHPWITFKDPSNVRGAQDHVGVIHSSNLCTEILLNTSKEETAVCNLGSINLSKHIKDNKLDEERLAKTIRTAIRMLDNVVDINFYPIEETKNANLRHRPIGMGIMGLQDVFYKLGISYASLEAVQFSDESMEMISYYAILASSELAKERGTYESYKGSKWDRGYLPIDTIDLLEKERGEAIMMDRSSKLDWSKVREHIKAHGMRNSHTMAIAPTATIANIIGVVASIEPTYKNLFVKSNLSGEFTVPNSHLIEKLKDLGIWDEQMLDDLKYYDGSILEIDRIPEEVKRVFLTSFEIEPDWLIECASRRQKWIDMGQSLNLYLSEPSGKKIHEMYMNAWKKGIKTCYYLRCLAATQIEKSTTDINKRGLQPRWMKSSSASSRVVVEREEAPKACSLLDPGCESCQ